MRRIAFVLLFFINVCPLLAQNKQEASATDVAAIFTSLDNKVPVLRNLSDSASYALGVSIGRNLQQYHAKNIDEKLFAKALFDVLRGDSTAVVLSDQQVMVTIQNYFNEMQKEVAETNRKESEAFLSKNAKEQGVVTLPDGLQYKIIKAGDASLKPTEKDSVYVNYTGTFINGKEFDSTKNLGQPAKFILGSVIKGWTEGLQLIGKGGSIRLFIPSDLAYGERGAGNVIPANAALIFDVEMIDVIKAAPETKGN